MLATFSERMLYTFPCQATKAPLSRRGFKDATQGVWWPRSPLVGVPTGKRNGIDVLDVDGRAGREWLARNAIPQTRAHYTQRGVHLLFAHAPGLRCSTGRIADGVDVRAEGGYVIWWPREGYPIEEAELAEWPEWLLKEAMGPAKGEGSEGAHQYSSLPVNGVGDVGGSPTTGAVGYRLNGILRKVERAQKGKRNHALFWAGCRYAEMIARHEVSVGVARRLLIAGCEINGLWRDPKDGPERCMKTIASCIRSSGAEAIWRQGQGGENIYVLLPSPHHRQSPHPPASPIRGSPHD